MEEELQAVQKIIREAEELSAKRERERNIAVLEGLREQYNLKSMSLNKVRVAKYEALSDAVELIRGEDK